MVTLPRRTEASLLLLFGGTLCWAGLLLAAATAVWLVIDLQSTDWDPDVPPEWWVVQGWVVMRLVLVGIWLVVSVLGGILYRLAQAN